MEEPMTLRTLSKISRIYDSTVKEMREERSDAKKKVNLGKRK